MRKMRPIPKVLLNLLAILCYAASSGCTSKGEVEPPAITTLRKIRIASFERDDQKPGRPVIKVSIDQPVSATTAKELACLRDFEELRVLYLRQSKIGDDVVGYVRGLKKLERLN